MLFALPVYQTSTEKSRLLVVFSGKNRDFKAALAVLRWWTKDGRWEINGAGQVKQA
jgi:hypothetical protein